MMNFLIVVFIFAVALYFPTEKFIKWAKKRDDDRHRQQAKKFFMKMYYAAPSEREAEYWREKYNKGK